MIRCQGVTRLFPGRHATVRGLDDVSFEVPAGEFAAVKGPSGSGKSTLLLTLGGMQRPTLGTVQVAGANLYALSSAERARFRAHRIGFVFQLFHLVPYLTAFENVLAGWPDPPTEVRASARLVLEELGLAPRADHLPATLSAGEKQRVALARALVKKPALILADEPTGNLDPDNAGIVFRQLAAFHRQGGTVLMVTHGPDADTLATRQLRLNQGRLSDHTPNPAAPAAPAAPANPPSPATPA